MSQKHFAITPLVHRNTLLSIIRKERSITRAAKVMRKLNEPLIKADLHALTSLCEWRGTRGAREGRWNEVASVAGERTKRAAADPRVRAVMRRRNYIIRGWSARQYVRVNVIIKESITYSAARFGIPNFSLLPFTLHAFHVRASLIPRRSVSPGTPGASDEKFSAIGCRIQLNCNDEHATGNGPKWGRG